MKNRKHTKKSVFQVAVFWVVTPCSHVLGYQRFGGPCCLHLQGEVVCNHETTRRHKPEDCDLNLHRCESLTYHDIYFDMSEEYAFSHLEGRPIIFQHPLPHVNVSANTKCPVPDRVDG